MPVIACTAHRGGSDDAGLRVEHYLTKPVDVRALLHLIARYCAAEGKDRPDGDSQRS